MGWSDGVRSGLCQPTVEGITWRDTWAHTLYILSTLGSWFSICAMTCALVRVGKRNGSGRGERRIIADAAAMHHGRRRRKAELVVLKEVARAHAKAARVLEVILGPSERF
eukprot:scaffold4395_cov123-Isochrysis_galbana.AAC.5